MHPTLFHFGSFSIPSYGFWMTLGLAVALFLIRRKAKKENLSTEKVTDIVFYSFLMGLLGGRVLFVITTWENYRDNLIEIFKVWQGGLVFYGGLIATVTCMILLCRLYQIPVLRFLDITAPSMAIGHFFGRLGCFSAGCCFGHEADSSFPLSVVFDHPDSVAPQGVHLHPAQLYDAVNTLIIFTLLQIIYRKKKFNGQVIASYGMLYAVGRWIVEEFRGDSIRGFVAGGLLSTSQLISLIIFTLSAFVFLTLKTQKKSLG